MAENIGISPDDSRYAGIPIATPEYGILICWNREDGTIFIEMEKDVWNRRAKGEKFREETVNETVNFIFDNDDTNIPSAIRISNAYGYIRKKFPQQKGQNDD